MRPHHRLAALVTLLAGSALACGGPAPEDVGSEQADLTISFPPRPPPVVFSEVVPTVYVMLALSDLALAAASPLLHDSLANDSSSRYWATVDAPLAIVGGVAFFDNNLHASECEGNPCYTWHNKADGGAQGSVEDSSHGNWDVGLYAAIGERKARLDLLLATNGENEAVPIGPDAITRFANTFLHGIVSADPVYFNAKIDGSADSSLGGGCDGFAAMTRANPLVWERCRESSYDLPVTRRMTTRKSNRPAVCSRPRITRR